VNVTKRSLLLKERVTSQSQGSVERSNQDVRDMLAAHSAAWVTGYPKHTWSLALPFIYSKKNRTLHVGIKEIPRLCLVQNKRLDCEIQF